MGRWFAFIFLFWGRAWGCGSSPSVSPLHVASVDWFFLKGATGDMGGSPFLSGKMSCGFLFGFQISLQSHQKLGAFKTPPKPEGGGGALWLWVSLV